MVITAGFHPVDQGSNPCGGESGQLGLATLATRETFHDFLDSTSTGVWDETTDRFAPVHDVENTKG